MNSDLVPGLPWLIAVLALMGGIAVTAFKFALSEYSRRQVKRGRRARIHGKVDLEPKYEIFVSHSGVQKDFVEQLCEDLESFLYFPFFKRSLPKGERNPRIRFRAARQCQVAVVVLSEDFFTGSKRTMLELSTVVKAQKERHGFPRILPLFFKLTRAQCRNDRRREQWLKVWRRWARDDSRIVIEDWLEALKVLGSMNGIAYQSELGEVSYRKHVRAAIIGLVPSDQEFDTSFLQMILEKFHQNEASIKYGVRVVGLYGESGLGKTTVCKALCRRQSAEYDGNSCLAELGTVDPVELQKQVLRELTHVNPEILEGVPGSEVRHLFKQRMHRQKVFLAIDNVWDNPQSREETLHFLQAGFHRDSMVLVTARTLDILLRLNIDPSHCVEMPTLDKVEATKLFLQRALPHRRKLESDQLDVVERCVEHCRFVKDGGGFYYLPSAIVVLAYHLGGISDDPLDWRERLDDHPTLSKISGEAPAIDPIDKCHSCLDIALQCLAHVRELPSPKFNNEQCGYLGGKLNVVLRSANQFLVDAKLKPCTSEDMTRCTEVFKLLLALAHKIESFIQGCCREDWIQAAMTLTNTAEYVSSLGFDLELCQVYFSMGGAATIDLTTAEIDNIDRSEVENVKMKASRDVDVLLDKVNSELPFLRSKDMDLATYLLQRLRRGEPASTSLSPKSSFWDMLYDWGFLGRIFQKIHQEKLIGKGSSATVHKAVWLGIPVAKKTFYSPGHPDYVREAQILGGLCHPNIMSMLFCAMDERKCSIVMELMDEDLNSLMQRRVESNPRSPPFSVFEALDVILQIGEGVMYLHQNGIVHRDLKSFNVLVKNVMPKDLDVQYVHIKVADFGFSKMKESSTRYTAQTSNIGTNRWMAPEVIHLRNTEGQTSISALDEEGPKFPKKSDVYSFAMVCYEILTGDLPFSQETSLIKIKEEMLKGKRPILPEYCPSKLKDLIDECWDQEPTRRPSFESICSTLKHLKCLLMSGFSSCEDSHFKIGEPLQVSPGNTPFEAPTREVLV